MLREAFQKVKRKETVDIIKSHLLLSSRNAGEYRPDAWKSKAAILRNLSVSMTELKARRMLKIDTGNLKCFLNLLALAERKMYQYWDNRGVGGAVVAHSPRDLKRSQVRPLQLTRRFACTVVIGKNIRSAVIHVSCLLACDV